MEITTAGIIKDGYPSRVYDGRELVHGDTVWIGIPGLEDIGDWAVIDEDGNGNDPMVSARFLDEQYPMTIARANIKYERLPEA